MAIVNLLEHTTSADPEIVTKIDELLIAGFLNRLFFSLLNLN